MSIPTRYKDLRKTLPDRMTFGCGGIELYPSQEIEANQVGYSVTPDGSSLCSGENGAWHSAWIVIGHETACGDPIFIDTGVAELPVCTAMHGEGAWEPNLIAISAEAFANCCREFSRIATGRGSPGELDRNPLSNEDRSRFLDQIAELNRGAAASQFWDLQLSC